RFPRTPRRRASPLVNREPRGRQESLVRGIFHPCCRATLHRRREPFILDPTAVGQGATWLAPLLPPGRVVPRLLRPFTYRDPVGNRAGVPMLSRARLAAMLAASRY